MYCTICVQSLSGPGNTFEVYIFITAPFLITTLSLR